MADGESREVEDEQIAHFCSVSGVDKSVARYFLTESNWDLQVALNNHFEVGSEGFSATSGNQRLPTQTGTSGDPIVIRDDPDVSIGETVQVLFEVTAEEAKTRQISGETNKGEVFKLLSWNVDGLDQINLVERSKAVCQMIKTHQPDVVFLQEVVQESLPIFKSSCLGYISVVEWAIPQYFNMILLRSSTVKTCTEKPLSVGFPGTTMGRYILDQSILFHGQSRFVLLTSHLESTSNAAAERKRQLKQVFELLQSKDPSFTILFGGDLNLRDREVSAVGVPVDVIDAWEACGSHADSRYTWDVGENDNLDWEYPNKPKCRFDRMFVRPGLGDNRFIPSKFSLVGKLRLTCGRYPSDHWGIVCVLVKAHCSS